MLMRDLMTKVELPEWVTNVSFTLDRATVWVNGKQPPDWRKQLDAIVLPQGMEQLQPASTHGYLYRAYQLTNEVAPTGARKENEHETT